MMGEIRNYLLSIVCVSLICGIAVTVVGKNESFGKVIKLLAGLIMAVVVIAPWTTIQINDISLYFESLELDAKDAVNDGIAYADEQKQAFIKEKAEAYIWDKAASLGAELEINVELSDEGFPKPIQVSLSGMISPYNKSILVKDISQNLGIPEEEQHWN